MTVLRYYCTHARPARQTALWPDWRSTVMAHRHLIGRTGSGKTTLAKEWLIQDIHDGYGVCYFDPHGHDTDDILNYIPKKRRGDVIIFDPTQYAIPWNPLVSENVPLTADTFATGIRVAYKFTDVSTSRLTGVLYNAFAALMETKQSLFGLYLILAHPQYRTQIIKDTTDPIVREFWEWLDGLPSKERLQQTESTYTKVQVLMADPRIRAICGSKTGFDFKDIVKDKILFVRLPQGELGLEKTALIGNLLLAQVHQACLGRDTTVPFSLYLDEVHTWAPFIVKEMLSGIRKFNVQVTGVHQYIRQLDPELLDSFTANSDQYIFRVSKDDAERLPKLKPNEIFGQLHELEPFEYVRFEGQRYSLHRTEPLSHPLYTASSREIHSNISRNLVAPATREVEALLARY